MGNKIKDIEYKHLVIDLTEQDWKDLSTLCTRELLKILAKHKNNGKKV